uniref:Uncharacterized protein n=1 Tax=Anguilla anguilla TaxID=7936 RepID=A0A0E9XIR3_ANGAN
MHFPAIISALKCKKLEMNRTIKKSNEREKNTWFQN